MSRQQSSAPNESEVARKVKTVRKPRPWSVWLLWGGKLGRPRSWFRMGRYVSKAIAEGNCHSPADIAAEALRCRRIKFKRLTA